MFDFVGELATWVGVLGTFMGAAGTIGGRDIWARIRFRKQRKVPITGTWQANWSIRQGDKLVDYTKGKVEFERGRGLEVKGTAYDVEKSESFVLKGWIGERNQDLVVLSYEYEESQWIGAVVIERHVASGKSHWSGHWNGWVEARTVASGEVVFTVA